MIEFLKGISPSLRAQVCDHVFKAMFFKNQILHQLFLSNDKKTFLDFILPMIDIMFVPPEAIIVS